MQILSTVDAWLGVAGRPDPRERVSAWTSQYEARFPTVFSVYYRSWGQADRREVAALGAPGLVDRVRGSEVWVRGLLRAAEDDFRGRGLLSDDELHAVLMVGVGTSNGWVADHDGMRTLFLALEMLGSPPHDDVLVVHELTHLVQGQLAAPATAPTFPASFAILVEGAAVATTRVLRPHLSDSAYLWMDEQHQHWFGDCQAATSQIAGMVLDNLDTPDDADAVAPLLRNRPGPGVPPRAGYWVGDQIAAGLLTHGHTLREVLSIDPRQARDLVTHWAHDRSTPAGVP